jgi:hypothetical protein
LKRNIKIFDILFKHAKYSTDNQDSKYINWIRSNVDPNDDIVFYTDKNLNTIDLHKNFKFKKYGWLIESPLVTNSSYDWIKNNYNKFDNIFTHNKKLLNLSDKFKFSPTGGCWIYKKDHNIYNKSKNISIIASNKNYLEGHKLRHIIINKYKNIDIYGRSYNPIENKLEGLKDYRFSFVIENTKIDYYFTEKLIDCFVTGTIPIYWGCPSINKFFNEKGMIIINDINNIDINILNEKTYKNMLPYILENFKISNEYLMSEDYIYEKYLKK